MADNSSQGGTDTIRDLARVAGSVKTQVFQLDLGGASANAEVLITAGQQLMAASVPVVFASNQSALPVTGTFWQTTQPVSMATMPALVAGSAVVGKFGIDQTTPGTTNLVATNADIAVGAGTASAKAILGGGVYNAVRLTLTTGQSAALQLDADGSQYVNVADWTLAATTLLGKVGIDQTTPGTTNGVVLNAGTAIAGKFGIDQTTPGTTNGVSGPTITKGTQATTGFTVQELKDAGRNQTNYFMAAQVITTAAEVLQSLTGYKGGAAVTATTTPAVVTTGKTYRINRITITYVAVATAGSALVTLRCNLAGVVALGSPLVDSWLVGGPSATAGATQTVQFDFPDGIEIPAAAGIGIGVTGIGATGTAAIVGYVKVSVGGFEY